MTAANWWSTRRGGREGGCGVSNIEGESQMPARKQAAAPEAPTEQETAQGLQVAAAGAQAAREEPDPEKRPAAAAGAIQQAASEQGWTLTDEECDRIGGAVVKQMEQRGAFDPPPEPVAAPAAPTGAGTAAAQPPDLPVENLPPAPQHRSFAERFRGGGR